jgi:hypothetical protein
MKFRLSGIISQKSYVATFFNSLFLSFNTKKLSKPSLGHRPLGSILFASLLNSVKSYLLFLTEFIFPLTNKFYFKKLLLNIFYLLDLKTCYILRVKIKIFIGKYFHIMIVYFFRLTGQIKIRMIC